MNYVAVCTPARDMVHTNYTYCMVNMVAYHTLNTTDAVSLKILQGTLILNQCALQYLEADSVSGVQCVVRHHVDHAIGVVGVNHVTRWRADCDVVHTEPGLTLKNRLSGSFNHFFM